LAAFVLAVREINNKSDGIFDDVLPSTTLQFAVRGGGAYMNLDFVDFIFLEEAFNNDGVVGAVNAQDNGDALLTGVLSTKLWTPIVNSVANSGLFDDHYTYPFVSKVVALESYQGLVLQNLLCTYFNARKVVIFTSTVQDDIELVNTFLDAPYCELNILAELNVRSGDTDFTPQVNAAISTGARYFVLFLPADQAALLLEQGYDLGLFHANSVFLAPDRASTNITRYFSPSADINAIMTGFFSLRYWPNYYLNRAPASNSFARRWGAQASTAGTVVNNVESCDATTDDDGSSLYQVIVNNVTICTGIDFTSYDPSGLTIQAFTAHTYDATVLLALALDFAIKEKLNYNDAEVIQSILVNNISYVGASGPINLYEGQSQYGYNGQGNRMTGNEYVVTNFNPDERSFYGDEHDAYMVPVGSFNGDAGTFISCAAANDTICFLPLFSAMTDGSYNNPPSDTPEAIFVELNVAYALILYIMSFITASLVLIFFFFTLVKRNSKVIKASQPALLYCILSGGLVAAARIFLGGLDKTDSVCVAEYWFGHLSFVIMIGSLYVKSYRVHRIVNTRTIRKVTFSAVDALKMLAGFVFGTFVYLSISIVFGEPHVHISRTTLANQETVIEYCSMLNPQYQTALFAMEAAFLLVAFRVCWEIRNVPDIVNESKQISTGSMTQLILLPYVLTFLPFEFLQQCLPLC
jgi:ABC-type branched-subunit amino acid transport system substrate-binding protein